MVPFTVTLPFAMKTLLLALNPQSAGIVKSVSLIVTLDEPYVTSSVNLTTQGDFAPDVAYVMVKSLSDTANGSVNQKQKITLETFVQTTYFDRIIKRANTHFFKMSDGHYDFIRSKEAKKSGKSGLDIDVIDHYNSSERSVKSLSGGESFIASLSLALGMSEEIQASAGGIKIDTMFVDEGFGTLDEETLRLSMKALNELSDQNRLIGIISHVPELRERIDKQIVVSKNKGNGSKVEIRLD